MIVADTSLLVNFYLETEFTQNAENVYKKDPFWIVPPTWKEEFANVLVKLVQKNLKPAKEALDFFKYVVSELKNYERNVIWNEVMEVAITQKITVYDAHFVRLAENYGVMMVTHDLEIVKKCPSRAISIKEF